MQAYEVLIEEVNPCRGNTHGQKRLVDALAQNPEAYVRSLGHYPILDIGYTAAGDTVITTGDGKGYLIRYTFLG